MRLDFEGANVTLTLSRRNLLALLAKVDDPHSAKTIFSTEHIYLDGEPIYGKGLWLTCEPDAQHYADPQRNFPWGGRMHPDTEGFIAQSEGDKV